MKYDVNIVKGVIANAITSAALDHVVATANDIYDEKLGDYQENLNQKFNNAIETTTRIWVEPIPQKQNKFKLCIRTKTNEE